MTGQKSEEQVALETKVANLNNEVSQLVFNQFTLDDAWVLGSSAVKIGQERKLPITVQIRRGEQLVFHAALDGTTADNDTWVERKARSVRRFQVASYPLGLSHKAKGSDFNSDTGLDFNQYVAHGGCIPIMVKNVGLVGTLTISGLPSEDDHTLAVQLIRDFLSA